MDNQIIEVSVLCITYNHEAYIRKALESLVNQKTSFAYEIIVHDDASTDNTASIIREFASKYPDLIKPIIQETNQYTKGVDIIRTCILSSAKGKYIAYCEGDDYWTDDEKLEKQFKLMEQNPLIDICSHANSIEDLEAKKTYVNRKKQSISTIDTKDVILGGGDYVATNSLFFRKTIMENVPAFYSKLPIDYTIQVLGSLKGGMLYIPDNMSCYRYMIKNSWTWRVKKNKSMLRRHICRWLDMLKQMDDDTDHLYSDVIGERTLKSCVSQHMPRSFNNELIKKYKQSFKKLNFKEKLKIKAKRFFSSFRDNGSIVEHTSNSIDSQSIKNIALQILIEVDKICRENDFKYFLCGGTLLGAVRHKGFIPWDDDVDILMPRPDYDRFIEFCKNNKTPFTLFSLSTNKKYNQMYAKACDPNTIVFDKEAKLKMCNFGIWVDIFPLDGAGNDKNDAVKFYKKNLPLFYFFNAARWKKYFKSKNKIFFHSISRFTLFLLSRFANCHSLALKVEKKYKRRAFEKHAFCSNFFGAYGAKEIVNKAFFDERKELSFENHLFYVPGRYEEYLENIYGNWMELPPVEKRISNHDFDAYYLSGSAGSKNDSTRF